MPSSGRHTGFTTSGAPAARPGGPLGALRAAIAVLRWPFDRLRAKSREIDYHSARRVRDRWTRLADLWIVGSLPIAFALVALTANIVPIERTLILAQGTLEQRTNGELTASLAKPGSPVGSSGRFVATIDLRQTQRSGSWPVPLWHQVEPAEILILDARRTRTISLDADAIEAKAVRDAIERGEQWLHRAVEPEASRTVHVGTWIGATVVSWVVLLPVGLLALSLLRVGSALAARGREHRARSLRRQHRCVRCGYDLHGSDFASNCPECGATLA